MAICYSYVCCKWVTQGVHHSFSSLSCAPSCPPEAEQKGMLCLLYALQCNTFSHWCATHPADNATCTAQKPEQACKHLYSVATLVASWLVDEVPCQDGGVIPIPVHTHAHTLTHIRTYTHIHTYTHTHIHTYTHTHIHTYAHTHIRTYAQTHLRTYKLKAYVSALQ